MTFPTEKQFRQWWQGKEDEKKLGQWRQQTCPIARYLREHGHPDAVVISAVWYPSWVSFSSPLPKWAVEAIKLFDRKLK